MDNIQAVNYVETTVEWEQWAVADEPDSDSNHTDLLSLTCHCWVFDCVSVTATVILWRIVFVFVQN